MANADGSTFMQVQIKCDDCPDVHWLNSYYVFAPKIGPLRFGHAYRGTNAVLVENISELTQSEIDAKLKTLEELLDVEYGLCSGCGRDREHISTHSEFADFGILNFHESETTSDSPENNFLDSTRQVSSSQASNTRPVVSSQSELFRDSALEGLSGYLGSVMIEADIVTLAPIPESDELTQ